MALGIPDYANASFAAQAEPDAVDFDAILLGFNQTGVVTGCACTPGSSGVNLSVAVAAGTVIVAGTQATVTGVTVTPGAAHATLARFDLVVVSALGTVSVTAGTAATTPVFPSIPASSVVLAAVYIPATVTSITAANIVDKRVVLGLVIGTGSTNAAAGNHTHAGSYASTAHAATHAAGGSDQITSLGALSISPMDGTGVLTFGGSTSDLSAPSGDDHINMGAMWRGWRPVWSMRSLDRTIPMGEIVFGKEPQMLVLPNTGSSALLSPLAALTSAGTVTHPTASSTLGRRAQLATAASANATAVLSSTDTLWLRGDAAGPVWYGIWYHARVIFPDASYANSGASTGTRMFFGLTDQTVATMLGSDNPAGNRIGISYCNVNGGLTNTTFWFTSKDGTTEDRIDTGITLTQNQVYDFWVHMRPGGGYNFFEIQNLSTGATTGSQINTNGHLPGATTFMRMVSGLQTINAVARAWQLHRVGCEAPY